MTTGGRVCTPCPAFEWIVSTARANATAAGPRGRLCSLARSYAYSPHPLGHVCQPLMVARRTRYRHARGSTSPGRSTAIQAQSCIVCYRGPAARNEICLPGLGPSDNGRGDRASTARNLDPVGPSFSPATDHPAAILCPPRPRYPDRAPPPEHARSPIPGALP